LLSHALTRDKGFFFSNSKNFTHFARFTRKKTALQEEGGQDDPFQAKTGEDPFCYGDIMSFYVYFVKCNY